MRSLLGVCLLTCITAVLSLSQVLAQSGVLSGPPQIQRTPGGPGPGPVHRQQDLTWIAVVGGFDGRGRRVSVGYSGYQRSRHQAEDAAISACRRDRSVNCRNPFAVSTGCLYIVPGNRRSGGVSWGRGATQDIAVAECRRGGYNCPRNKIIGGCVPGHR